MKVILRVCLIIISALIINANADSDVMKLVPVSQSKYPDTGCLDGSKFGYYFKPATNAAGSKNWIINLEGGGECISKRSCTARSLTPHGTSKEWKLTSKPVHIQDPSEVRNPTFYNYNQIFVPYCSGDLFLGLDKAKNARAFDLQFSGFNNLQAVISELLTVHNMHKADKIIYTGVSAGGIGAVATVDHFHTRVSQAATKNHLPVPTVLAAPLAGFYFNNDKPYIAKDPKPIAYIKWAYEDLKKYAELYNAYLPPNCTNDGSGNPWECMFAQRSYRTLKTPIFFTYSQIDNVVMPLHDGLPPVWNNQPKQCHTSTATCPAPVRDYILAWGKQMKSTEEIVISNVTSGRRKDGLFSVPCLTHTGFNYHFPRVNGTNFLEALTYWTKVGYKVGGSKNIFRDTCMYQTNKFMCGECATL